MYHYLLWDVDNTILDFPAAEAYAVRALFQKYHLGICTDEMLERYSKINAKYWQALERNEMTKPEILVGRFQEFFTLIGVDPELSETFNRDYQETLGEHVVFMEYAKEALQEEKGNYVLAAVTNGTKIAQTKKLKKSGLDQIFDAVFISEDVGVEKPNAAFFDFVFETLSITDKSQVLLIGDSLTSDMQGGKNAGIDTCWYNPRHAVNDRMAVTYEIEDFRQLAKILANDRKKKVQERRGKTDENCSDL